MDKPNVKKPGSTEDTGAADSQMHYINSAYQPLEVMQRLMSKDEFCGFLIGNAIKYMLRAGNKDSASKDLTKARQYAYWFTQVKLYDKVVKPGADSVSEDFEIESLFSL